MVRAIPCRISGSGGCARSSGWAWPDPAGPARWVLAQDAEQRLRELGERGDIIKRLHKTLTKDGAARGTSSWALEGESHGEPVIGRLVARGLDDELRGTAFAVVDGIDARGHHLKLPEIEAAGR